MRKCSVVGSLVFALSLLAGSLSYAAAPAKHSPHPAAHATSKGLWRAFLSALGLAPSTGPGVSAAVPTDTGGGADPDGKPRVAPTVDARGGADPDGK